MDNLNLQPKKFFRAQNIFTIVALLVLFVFAVTIPLIPKGKTEQSGDKKENTEKNQEEKPATFSNPFKEITLESQSAIVWDIKARKPLYEKNSERIMPLASITKILTATLTYDLLPPNTEVRIDNEFLAAEGDSGLFTNESWILKDLVDFTMMTSSNDGARALASVSGSILSGTQDFEIGRQHFIDQMNRKISDIGLRDILVRNETGLDEDEFQSGGYGSAKEVAMLFEYIFKKHPEVFDSTKKSEKDFISLDKIVHSASNTNVIVNEIPGIIGSKTGFTDLAGGNLGVIFDPSIGRPIITIVLGSSYDGRFSDTKKLIDATREYIIQEKFVKEASEIELNQK